MDQQSKAIQAKSSQNQTESNPNQAKPSPNQAKSKSKADRNPNQNQNPRKSYRELSENLMKILEILEILEVLEPKAQEVLASLPAPLRSATGTGPTPPIPARGAPSYAGPGLS